MEHLGRIKSEKNIAKVENWESLKDYKIGSVIGRGSYAVVRMCRNCQGKKFAIKTYARSSLHNNDKKVNL